MAVDHTLEELMATLGNHISYQNKCVCLARLILCYNPSVKQSSKYSLGK